MRQVKVVLMISILGGANFANIVTGQEISKAFEFRYVSDDPAANGETDFKGETAVFDTEQRVQFLGQYAEYAKDSFNDPNLDTKVVTNEEVEAALKTLKELPLPEVRERILLKDWKWLGYRKDQREEEINELAWWENIEGTEVKDSSLVFLDKRVLFQRSFPSQSWRFSMQWKAKTPRTDARGTFSLSDRNKILATTVGFNNNGQIFYRSGEKEVGFASYTANTWYEFKIEVDLPAGRYNFYVDGQLKADYVELQTDPTRLGQVNTFSVDGIEGEALDDIWGVGYSPTDRVRHPYTIETFLDQHFEIKPPIEGWTNRAYDDSKWKTASLPIVRGSERYAGEDLYLRNTIHIGDFSRAVLSIETLDPEGEIWINGKVVAVLTNRHPAEVDVSKYLKKRKLNFIAVRVNHFYLSESVGKMMGHTALDYNIGWFAGRMSLDLTARSYIDDVLVYAQDVSDPAKMQARIQIKNEGWKSFRGNVVVNFYPWYPEEGAISVATTKFPVTVSPGSAEFKREINIPNPKLWTFRDPNLYKVEVILENESEETIDDYVVTTGIRTVSQEGGTFRVNGKPAMLNGAQIFGFRSPLENLVTWNRCAPKEWLVKEILMIKKMNGNLLRIHVHAWQSPARNINDPRIAEIADQLGMMIIWATPAWTRTGEGWGQIDFEGYPIYMQQVYNHPSIVMWEASNHPRFKHWDLKESNLFCEKVYQTIYPVDPSRLISTTSYIHHLHFGNDSGTIDYQGNPMEPSPTWTASMVTRGNQDSFTGYGREWTILRKLPNTNLRKYLNTFLDSKERAYFNFEHEESIGQPNWNLVKGKPWYHLQSYEWYYDEGSIGRKLTVDEWQESQAWQAFSAWESMKKQRILDYDGFSWCCLHGGPNTATYKKPLIDFLGHAKLAYYTNRMVFQDIVAGSNNVDVVYGPDDVISPLIMNLGESETVDLEIVVKDMNKEVISSKKYSNVKLPAGRTVTPLPEFKPVFPEKGYYAVEYLVK